ncbi:MAG: Rossman fold protein, TIGR00730 family, partial [Actinomycetota bacterium]
FIRETLVPRKLVSAQDLALYKVCNSVEQAVLEIDNFYSIYHSMRYVGKKLVLRLNKPLTKSQIDDLNASFADICVGESHLEVVKTSRQEIDDNDNPDKFRLALQFARRDFGRLRQLIDAINRF